MTVSVTRGFGTVVMGVRVDGHMSSRYRIQGLKSVNSRAVDARRVETIVTKVGLV
jgi:hypothetical protein